MIFFFKIRILYSNTNGHKTFERMLNLSSISFVTKTSHHVNNIYMQNNNKKIIPKSNTSCFYGVKYIVFPCCDDVFVFYLPNI